MKCHKCGFEFDKNVRVCPKCGGKGYEPETHIKNNVNSRLNSEIVFGLNKAQPTLERNKRVNRPAQVQQPGNDEIRKRAVAMSSPDYKPGSYKSQTQIPAAQVANAKGAKKGTAGTVVGLIGCFIAFNDELFPAGFVLGLLGIILAIAGKKKVSFLSILAIIISIINLLFYIGIF